ncbi:class I SAM-dependent methyltransferase [uncultured Microbacterium sp.]|uniref:class I SAM-dependent methyltransferase n=1 Tax=uncultured Microbacterium sp. TaxID=191216 RepID=UPI0035C945FB
MIDADAADRLILDESASARATTPPGAFVVIGDESGALTRAVLGDGAGHVRVHQDSVTAEWTLRDAVADPDRARSLGLDPALVTDAGTVLVRLPRSLDALRDIAGLIAAHARPDVVVFAGGRIKHMSLTMNDVLREYFTTVDVTHARQKSRVLIARGPHDGADPMPRTARHNLPGLSEPIVVSALGGVFAGTSIDIGTRFLIENLPGRLPEGGDVVDLACGTGVVAVWLALQHPDITVLATDRSSAAVTSARATAAANGIAERVQVVRDDGLASRPDGSAAFIALNPPFHEGAAVDERLAFWLFADAARALRPGGELWTVWNSPLAYRSALERIVGPTRQVARNAKFTVAASTRR